MFTIDNILGENNPTTNGVTYTDMALNEIITPSGIPEGMLYHHANDKNQGWHSKENHEPSFTDKQNESHEHNSFSLREFDTSKGYNYSEGYSAQGDGQSFDFPSIGTHVFNIGNGNESKSWLDDSSETTTLNTSMFNTTDHFPSIGTHVFNIENTVVRPINITEKVTAQSDDVAIMGSGWGNNDHHNITDSVNELFTDVTVDYGLPKHIHNIGNMDVEKTSVDNNEVSVTSEDMSLVTEMSVKSDGFETIDSVESIDSAVDYGLPKHIHNIGNMDVEKTSVDNNEIDSSFDSPTFDFQSIEMFGFEDPFLEDIDVLNSSSPEHTDYGLPKHIHNIGNMEVEKTGVDNAEVSMTEMPEDMSLVTEMSVKSDSFETTNPVESFDSAVDYGLPKHIHNIGNMDTEKLAVDNNEMFMTEMSVESVSDRFETTESVVDYGLPNHIHNIGSMDTEKLDFDGGWTEACLDDNANHLTEQSDDLATMSDLHKFEETLGSESMNFADVGNELTNVANSPESGVFGEEVDDVMYAVG